MSAQVITEIPPITDPLGKYWDQPPRTNILVDDKHAVMARADFGELGEYSHSIPTGVYVGKMWKAKGPDGRWWLRWYDIHPDPDKVMIHSKEILLLQ